MHGFWIRHSKGITFAVEVYFIDNVFFIVNQFGGTDEYHYTFGDTFEAITVAQLELLCSKIWDRFMLDSASGQRKVFIDICSMLDEIHQAMK